MLVQPGLAGVRPANLKSYPRSLTLPHVSPTQYLGRVGSLPRRSKHRARYSAIALSAVSSVTDGVNHNAHGARLDEPALVCIPEVYLRQNAPRAGEIPGFVVHSTTEPPPSLNFQACLSFWKAEIQSAAAATPRDRALYVVGEGSGALIAIVAAASTGLSVDRLVLINPPTAFTTSLLRQLLTLPAPPLLSSILPPWFPWQLNLPSPPAQTLGGPMPPPGESIQTPGEQRAARRTGSSTRSIGGGSAESSTASSSNGSTERSAGSSEGGSTGNSTRGSTGSGTNNSTGRNTIYTNTRSSTGSVVSGKAGVAESSTTGGAQNSATGGLGTSESPVPFPFSLQLPNPFAPASLQLPSGVLQETAEKLQLVLREARGNLQPLLAAPAEERAQYVRFLDEAAEAAGKLLGSVQPRTLVLAGAQDLLLDSPKESERLAQSLPRCQARVLPEYAHSMLSTPGFDLRAQLEVADFYTPRLRFTSPGAPVPMGRPGPIELPSEWDVRWASRQRGGLDDLLRVLCSPVFISTREGGERVEGVSALPECGPLLVVGNHQLMAPDTPQLVQQVLTEKGLLLRGLGHPALFLGPEEAAQQLGFLSALQGPVAAVFQNYGAVPVGPAALYKLMQAGEAALLYPGGEREIYKRRNEKYRLFWPERAEFVRTASKFGATLLPLAAVGVEECVDVVLDSQQLLNTPLLGAALKRAVSGAPKARAGATDVLHFQQSFMPPLVSVSVPARLYFLFQEPIRLDPGMYRDKQACQEVYEQVRGCVQEGISWLQQKRSEDPYADFTSRLVYENPLGGEARRAPTFRL